MLKVLEAFAGVGTTRMALERVLPCDYVGIIENSSMKIKAYQTCHGDKEPVWKDIRDVDPWRLPDHDLFTYSFPCTDLSKEGKGEGFDGKNSSLLFECEKIIAIKRPRYLLCENVPQLFSKKNEEGFLKWLDILENLGYSNYCFKIKGCDQGVPQNRDRAFIASFKNPASFSVPTPKSFVTLKNYLGREYISKLPLMDDNGLMFKIGNADYVKEAVVAGYSFVDYYDTVNCSFPTSRTRRGRVGRQMAQTLLKSPQMGIWTSKGLRKINGETAMRLMGIEEHYIYKLMKFGFSDNQLHSIAGDAIIVDVLEAIFREMFRNY